MPQTKGRFFHLRNENWNHFRIFFPSRMSKKRKNQDTFKQIKWRRTFFLASFAKSTICCTKIKMYLQPGKSAGIEKIN